jgi:hypothetical protein
MPAKPNKDDVRRKADQLRALVPFTTVVALKEGATTYALDIDGKEIFRGLPVGWTYATLATLVRWEAARGVSDAR